MCLNTNQKVAKIADRDIPVYKYLLLKREKGKHIPTIGNSLIYNKEWKLIRGTKFTEPNFKKRILSREINLGLHSYDSKNYGVNTKFIIPKGAKYYQGYHNGKSGYVSDTLIFKHLIHK